ncbi:hypothetical protein AMJ80_02170 [bacterium SM23_31]|nr:MAG: hypothetical protein AMJ80_02170 [bacterium SM23_31]
MKKIIIIVIAFLLVTNISALTVIIYNSGLLTRRDATEESAIQSVMAEQFGISELQAAEISDIRASFVDELESAEIKLNEKQRELFAVISSENPDMSEANTLIDEISLLQAQLQKEAVKRMIQEKNLLDSLQQQKYLSEFDTRMGRGFGRGKGLGYGAGQGRGRGGQGWQKNIKY